MASTTCPTVTAPTTDFRDIGYVSIGTWKIRLPGYPIEAPEGHLKVKEDGTIGIGDGDVWLINNEENKVNGNPGGSYFIKLVNESEYLPRLAPQFPEGSGGECPPLEGPVALDTCGNAIWHFSLDVLSRGWLVTADVPPQLAFPPGGRLYLVAVNGVVSWKWSAAGGEAQADVPEGSLWKFFFIGD